MTHLKTFLVFVFIVALVFGATFGLCSVVCANSVYLHACSKVTCSRVENRPQTDVIVKDALYIGNSTECSNICSSVHYRAGTAHVLGNWLDLSCRFWGGDMCTFNRTIFAGQELRELMRELTVPSGQLSK